MAEPQLSVRSSKARKLAHLLAKKERRTIAQVVESALELYARAEPTKEAARDFYTRVASDFGVDIDLDAVIREDRKPNPGIEL
jgi:hypothetical protein